MNRTSVYFLTLTFFMTIAASIKSAELDPAEVIEIEEVNTAVDTTMFSIRNLSIAGLEAGFEVEGFCVDSKRNLNVQGSELVEVRPEYFSNGMVRQYVVFLEAKEAGRIKIIREPCVTGQKCDQPRIQLTDPSDRIVAEIAPSENEKNRVFARNNLSQISASAEFFNQRWRVKIGDLDKSLGVLLICIARLEREPCAHQNASKKIVKFAMLGTLVAVVAGGIYLKYG